jgi:hypothetical protein
MTTFPYRQWALAESSQSIMAAILPNRLFVQNLEKMDIQHPKNSSKPF